MHGARMDETAAAGDASGVVALPCAHGGPLFAGKLRTTPEDFIVVEELGFVPSGSGEHWLVRVEKRGANTAWVAGRLAKWGHVRERDVGYSGLKDRHALTSQWFSIPVCRGHDVDWMAFAESGITVRAAARHHRKLRRGTHAANQFVIRIKQVNTECSQSNRSSLIQRLKRIHAQGVPNYFGVQRFGRDGNNLSRAKAWLEGGAPAPRRHQKSMLLSAARAHLFNVVLSERVLRGNWNQVIDGDLANLNGSRSVFAVDVLSDDLIERCRTMDIHPTGPMPGRGQSTLAGEAFDIEHTALSPYAEMVKALADQGVDAARRPLRVMVQDMAWRVGEQGSDHSGLPHDVVTLRFTLPAGAFATAVLREVLSTDSPSFD